MNYFNYYNFENFKYLLNILNNKEILAPSKYLDYLTLKDGIIKKKFIKKKFKYYEEKNINYIHDFNHLKYFKDNIFYNYEEDDFIFFEFKDYSFESLLSFHLTKNEVHEIKPSQYRNYLFLNMRFTSNIKIYEYDLLNKTITLIKKEIGDNQMFNRFDSFFDNENGNVITKSNKTIIVWKNDDKNNCFTKFLTINDVFYSLYNINSKLFCFQDDKYNLKFYDTNSYQCNKVINYSKKLNPLGTIKKEMILFINEVNEGNEVNEEYMLLINIKFLEIVQIFKYISNQVEYLRTPILCNDSIFNFAKKLKRIIITKRKFNYNEGCFDKNETSINLEDCYFFANIIKTDIGFIIVCGINNMIFINAN